MRSSSHSLLSALAGLFVVASLTGCGIGTVATSSVAELNLHGSAFGGQQPVSGATVNLYVAGKMSNGSAALSLLSTLGTTNNGGQFLLTGVAACGSADDEVFLTATGGNPGLAPGTFNSALVLMAAAGRCGDLSSAPFVNINELTTVATVWALAPFMTSATNLGASSTNGVGIKNGFLNAGLLVNSGTGAPPTLPANLTTETGKIYALGNAMASCVNSDGTAGCSALFTAATPAGGTRPSNTVQAVLNIVKNPSNNVSQVFNASSSFAPFPVVLTSAPNDWTMSLTVTGGGLIQPTVVRVDKAGNVWAANYPGGVSDFTPQGTPINPTALGGSGLTHTYGLTIDTSDNVWATTNDGPVHSTTRGSLLKLAGNSSGTPGTVLANVQDASLNFPEPLAADSNGDIVVGNYASSSGPYSVYRNDGTLLLGNTTINGAAFPSAVALDATHGFWLANGSDFTVSHIAADGTLLARPTCCNSPSGMAVDAMGNAWASNYGDDSLSEINAAGAVVIADVKGGGLSSPSALAIDGAQDLWMPNYVGGTISHFAGNGSTKAAGTPLSPITGLGLDASLTLPFSIAVDQTGNVWVANYAMDDLVMFFGLATPVKSPLNVVPTAP